MFPSGTGSRTVNESPGLLSRRTTCCALSIDSGHSCHPFLFTLLPAPPHDPVTEAPDSQGEHGSAARKLCMSCSHWRTFIFNLKTSPLSLGLLNRLHYCSACSVLSLFSPFPHNAAVTVFFFNLKHKPYVQALKNCLKSSA